MKKRFLSILLALVMLVGLLPTVALADESVLYITLPEEMLAASITLGQTPAPFPIDNDDLTKYSSNAGDFGYKTDSKRFYLGNWRTCPEEEYDDYPDGKGNFWTTMEGSYAAYAAGNTYGKMIFIQKDTLTKMPDKLSVNGVLYNTLVSVQGYYYCILNLGALDASGTLSGGDFDGIAKPDYFSVTNTGTGTATLKWAKYDNPTLPTLQYSTDGTAFNNVTIGTTEIQLTQGATVYFKGDYTSASIIYNKYIYLTCTGTGAKLKLGGDLTTLLNGTGNVSDLTSYTQYLFAGLFKNLDALTDASALKLPSTTLGLGCYDIMFYDCDSLEKAPALPATTLAGSCYYQMFYNCASLVNAPALPAEVLADYCYGSMFQGCESLEKAPALPVTALAIGCYRQMFQGCTSLKTAPALPATTLAEECYKNMFCGCPLKTAPALPATALAASCYSYMFQQCASLVNAPALPAMTLAASCYEGMFSGCTSLKTAPELPATVLTSKCYKSMFQQCESLEKAPALPATTLVDDCYYTMFNKCSSLDSITIELTQFQPPNTNSDSYYWLSQVAATGIAYVPKGFTIAPDYRASSTIPESWTIYSGPRITVNKAKTEDDPPVDVKNPVYGAAMDETDFFTVATKNFDVEPETLVLEWKQSDGSWGATAPTGITAELKDGVISIATEATLNAGDYEFRVTNNENEFTEGTTPNPDFVSGSGKLTVEKCATLPQGTPTAKTVRGSINMDDQTGDIDAALLGLSSIGVTDISFGTETDESNIVTIDTGAKTYTFANTPTKATATLKLTVESTNYEDFEFTLTFETVDKTPVDVSGVSMAYPNSQTNFIYGDTVGYTGTPAAVETGTTTAATITNWDYTYHQNTGTEQSPSWTKLEAAPTDAGSYKLVVAADDETYAGEQEIKFTIAKKTVTLIWSTIGTGDDAYKATYNGEDQTDKITVHFVDNSQDVFLDCDVYIIGANGGSDSFKDVTPYGYEASVAISTYNTNKLGANYQLPSEDTQIYYMKPAPVTVTTVPVADKVYNGKTDDASITLANVTFTGKFGNDDLTITGITGAYANANVGDDIVVTLNASSNWTLDGAAKANYVLASTGQPTTTTGNIKAFDLSTAAVTFDQESYTYTGSAVKPTVTVKDSDGNVIPSTDYKVSYTKNTDAGTVPTVTIEPAVGNTNVTGKKDVNFTINQIDQPVTVASTASVTINMTVNLSTNIGDDAKEDPNVSYAIDGEAHGCSVDASTGVFTAGATAGDVKVNVTFAATTNYKETVKTITVTVSLKTLVTVTATAENFTYGESGKTGFTAAGVTGHSELNGSLVPTYYLSDGTTKTNTTEGASGAGEMPTKAGTYKVTIAVPADNESYTGSTTLDFTIEKADVTTPPTLEQSVTILYPDETIAPKTGYELSTDSSFSSRITSAAAIDFTADYYIRKAEDENHNASEKTTYTPARPAAVTGVSVHQETIMKKDDASISGISSDMEYCFSTDGGSSFSKWTDNGSGSTIGFPFDTIPPVSRYDVKVRSKATASDFAGEETSFTLLPSTNKITVTLGEQTQQAAYGDKLKKPADPTRDDCCFGGWYCDTQYTQIWSFESDVVTDTMTLYPKWIRQSVPSAVISGCVTENSAPVPGAAVELRSGFSRIAATVTDAQGSYSFPFVENGVYNIVVVKADGKTKTALVEVNTTGSFSADVVLPTGSVSSVVEIQPSFVEGKADTAGTVVGELDAAASSNSVPASTVVVKLIVEPMDEVFVEHADEIRAEAGRSKSIEFLDMSLWKLVNGGNPDNIGSENQTLLTIRIPMKMTGLSDIAVYRYHEGGAGAGKVDVLTAAPNADGERIELGTDCVTIYAMKFSEYAIAYQQQSVYPSGGGSSSYPVTISETKNGTVTADAEAASEGQTVTITVTADKGFALETLTILDKSGKELPFTELGGGKYRFTMPNGRVTIRAVFMEDNAMLNFFVDVKADDYFYDAVLWAAENGITKGMDSTHFGPSIGTTRAQVVTFLWRTAGCPEPTGDASKFVDVEAGSYYEKAVAWAIEQVITKGTSDTTFSPDMVCTRAHIVTFLARFAGVKDTNTESVFSDVLSGDYFAAAVKWAKDNGVTDGISKDLFGPYQPCTRAQVVTFLYRWMLQQEKRQ